MPLPHTQWPPIGTPPPPPPFPSDRVPTGGLVQSTPAVGADGTVFTGTATGVLAVRPTDGSVLWKLSAGSAVTPGPAVAAGRTLVVGTDDGTVVAIA